MKKLPLSGIRVIDLSRVLAAPTCAQILGDMGAEVIKIERPGAGDEGRQHGVQAITDAEGRVIPSGTMFMASNRNKRGVAIDFSKPAGQEVVRQLAAKADVLVENFKTDSLAHYRLDHDSIKAINPRIVYCSVTGYGHTGPHRHKPGFNPIFQARGGWMSVNGSAEAPQFVPGNMADTISGYFAAMGVLAALYHRDRADDPAEKGQAIDVSMLEATVAAISLRAQDYLLSGEQPPYRTSITHVFTCADGKFVASTAPTGLFKRFCEVLGTPEWADDPRYATEAMRMKNMEIWSMIEERTKTRSYADLHTALEAATVPVAPINGFKQVFEDPQIKARGLTARTRHGSGKDIDVLTNPIRFSDTPIEKYDAPPMLGEHTEQVLREVLGMDTAALEALKRDQII